ncbi:MAG: 6,7-dimethyl-8-ribityllumazine synthase [Bacteroidota bacterium]|nr:6,7-dimethyl-8-ribityllumazine synthase [Bacteroidota bacterium]
MSTSNLSNYDIEKIPSAENMKFGIVISEWNNKITEALYNGAKETLLKHGAKGENITKEYVPGSFELTFGAAAMVAQNKVDAVIVLGNVIQGETRHFDFICHGVTQGITDLNRTTSTPVIFGVLTTETYRQAEDRAGGRLGNKGDEAAVTAIKMITFKNKLL